MYLLLLLGVAGACLWCLLIISRHHACQWPVCRPRNGAPPAAQCHKHLMVTACTVQEVDVASAHIYLLPNATAGPQLLCANQPRAVYPAWESAWRQHPHICSVAAGVRLAGRCSQLQVLGQPAVCAAAGRQQHTRRCVASSRAAALVPYCAFRGSA
jgi:hypothetical protein